MTRKTVTAWTPEPGDIIWRVFGDEVSPWVFISVSPVFSNSAAAKESSSWVVETPDSEARVLRSSTPKNWFHPTKRDAQLQSLKEMGAELNCLRKQLMDTERQIKEMEQRVNQYAQLIDKENSDESN
jgi:hypothetical protein